jgi:hypothetical protein
MRDGPTEHDSIINRTQLLTGGHTNTFIGWLPHLGDHSKLHATAKQATCYAAAKRGSEVYHRSSMMRATNLWSPILRTTMTAMVV